MIAATCRRCGSTALRKNGRTASGQQKFHCKDCNLYGTLDTKEAERQFRQRLIEQLSRERLSQRAIARSLKAGRVTIAKVLKKNSSTPGTDPPHASRTARS
jgi:transposase-like protein